MLGLADKSDALEALVRTDSEDTVAFGPAPQIHSKCGNTLLKYYNYLQYAQCPACQVVSFQYGEIGNDRAIAIL